MGRDLVAVAVGADDDSGTLFEQIALQKNCCYGHCSTSHFHTGYFVEMRSCAVDIPLGTKICFYLGYDVGEMLAVAYQQDVNTLPG